MLVLEGVHDQTVWKSSASSVSLSFRERFCDKNHGYKAATSKDHDYWNLHLLVSPLWVGAWTLQIPPFSRHLGLPNTSKPEVEDIGRHRDTCYICYGWMEMIQRACQRKQQLVLKGLMIPSGTFLELWWKAFYNNCVYEQWEKLPN